MRGSMVDIQAATAEIRLDSSVGLRKFYDINRLKLTTEIV